MTKSATSADICLWVNLKILGVLPLYTGVITSKERLNAAQAWYA
jgi:hypothetical protein